MDFKPFIYGLVDPLDPKHVRYVGMAGVRASRPYHHAKWARNANAKHCHLLHWVRKLHAEGREYSVLILEELSPGTSRRFLGEVEKMYIAALRDIGHNLTNQSEGGLGGKTRNVEQLAEMSLLQKGNKHGVGHICSEATRKQMSESRKRYFVEHPEAGAEISQRNLGNTYGAGGDGYDGIGTYERTDETRRKIGEASRKYRAEHPEVVAEFAARSKGNTYGSLRKNKNYPMPPWTPERRAKHAATIAARKLSQTQGA